MGVPSFALCALHACTYLRTISSSTPSMFKVYCIVTCVQVCQLTCVCISKWLKRHGRIYCCTFGNVPGSHHILFLLLFMLVVMALLFAQ